MRARFVTLLFVSFLAATLVAGYPAGISAQSVRDIKARAEQLYYGRGVVQDYSKALALYLQAARSGDAESQYIAGGMYFKGMGAEVDYGKAFMLLHTAAKNGHSTVESQKVLAQSFLLGRGVPKNYLEAKRWFTKAAKQGDGEALNELAFMYFVGNGVEQDYQTAYELFEEAAMEGMPLAQYNVGIMLYTGSGVESADLISSYAWLSIAAANGINAAISAQQFLEPVLTPAQLRIAQDKAQLFFEQIEQAALQ